MNAFPRTIAASLRNTFQQSSTAATSRWACSSCRRALNAGRGQQKTQIGGGAQRRTVWNSAPQKAAQDAHGARMEKLHEFYRYKNRTTMYYTLSVILGTVAFSYGSVPISAKPPAGAANPSAPRTTAAPRAPSDPNFDPASRLVPVTDAKRIRVTFNASVSDILPWKFTPQQREVRVLPGETALAFYTATNTSDKDIIGVATYSVTPAQTAPYFSKIQCFCFEEQRLNAGETVDMPVFFYLDPDMLNDLNMRGVETVTLSYTFFKARYDDHGNIQTGV
ncbi:cytochrome-c oxidase assembly protein [Apiospora aurea]|uniref:Cytochrome-c oxidase assembly protein n=1 Tax=Apiospora aurea TaxID=335848 RepID=A0ABR1Q9L1_9PEZI